MARVSHHRKSTGTKFYQLTSTCSPVMNWLDRYTDKQIDKNLTSSTDRQTAFMEKALIFT